MFSRIRKVFTEYKDLKYLAYHDPLTGLLNRNWLYKNINNISCKYVYFIDINDLHEVNKYGHTFGDEYIIKCINTIKLSKEDYLVRYAGDEFVLFTNKFHYLITNKLFSVGMAININIREAIKNADIQMIESKKLWKLTNKNYDRL